MFSLIVGFLEYLFRKDELHILILGLDKAGKTNVLERLKSTFSATPSAVGLDPGKILPTVGLNVGRLDAAGASFIFWDLGGQTGLRSIWDKYYDESHAIVYVVDAANRARFDESKVALERVLASRELAGAPLLVMANKQDIENAAGPGDVAAHFNLRADGGGSSSNSGGPGSSLAAAGGSSAGSSGGGSFLAATGGLGGSSGRAVKVIPVCAYTGQGLKEGVEWLADAVKKSSRISRLRVKHAR